MAFDPEQYGMLCDRLGRCLQRLGLKRVPRVVDADGARALARYFEIPVSPGEPASEEP